MKYNAQGHVSWDTARGAGFARIDVRKRTLLVTSAGLLSARLLTGLA